MKTMKTQRAVLPLAFLSAAFMLGCQDQGSEPVGPEGLAPLFHVSPKHPDGHGGDGGDGDNPGSPFYKYTFTGDITTAPSTADAKPTVGNDQNGDVVLQHCCDNPGVLEALKLSSGLLDQFELGGEQCFVGDITSAEFGGGLTPDKKVVNKVVARFRFTAQDKSGTPGVVYWLSLDGMVTTPEELDGTPTGGIFPPEPGETTTVTFTDASIGAARSKKEKNACSGDGGLPGGSSVLLEGTNTDPDL